MFLKGESEPTTRMVDDGAWVRSLTEAEAISADIPEVHVTHAAQGGTSQDQDVDPKKVRPMQTGEYVRKYVSRRLLASRERSHHS